MTKIKFCGLKTLDDIYYANEILPEYVGFVFAPKGQRDVASNVRAVPFNNFQLIAALEFLGVIHD